METSVQEKLATFLNSEGIRVRIDKLYYKKELDEESGRNVYKVTIVKEGKKGGFSYEWNDSIVNSNYWAGPWNKKKYFQTYEDAKRFASSVWMKVEQPSRKTPEPADVLYFAFEGTGSFKDFCENFGYDPDSINAFKIYTECQELYQKAENTIGRRAIDNINDILSDY